MTNSYPSVTPSEEYTGTSAGSGADTAKQTTDTAKKQAASVGHEAAAAVTQVSGVAKGEAAKVASEAKTQVKDLYHQTRGELRDQAGAQQERVATGLHSISDELHGMADKSEQNGVATDLVGQAASRISGMAKYLENRDPGSLLDDVKRFARQRPGTFIAIAATAGVLAGRLTRSLASDASDSAKTAAAQSRAAEQTPGTAYVTASYTTVPIASELPVSTGAHAAEPTMASAGYVAGVDAYSDSAFAEGSTDRGTLVDAEGTDVETSGYDPRTDVRNEFGADADQGAVGDKRPGTGLDGEISMGNSR